MKIYFFIKHGFIFTCPTWYAYYGYCVYTIYTHIYPHVYGHTRTHIALQIFNATNLIAILIPSKDKNH